MQDRASSRASTRRNRLPFACLAALAALTSSAALAKNARDFAGFYQVDGVSRQGQNYSVNLSVRIFNYSGADVANAKVLLRDSVLIDKTYATFPATSLIDRGNVVLKTTHIAIPIREYERWQRRGPVLEIQFQSPDGKNRQEAIDLIARPVGE